MPPASTRSVTAVVLAAGAGTRMGTPKALLSTPDGLSWAEAACRTALAAGCERVVVVLGAAAELVVLPTDAAVATVVNEVWPTGMASSLRAGLAAATGEAALVLVVDSPAMPVAVARRVVASRAPLARAVFDGRPGHPVLIGREHWTAVSASVTGDEGARDYLEAHGVVGIECGDLYDGHDIDEPSGL